MSPTLLVPKALMSGTWSRARCLACAGGDVCRGAAADKSCGFFSYFLFKKYGCVQLLLSTGTGACLIGADQNLYTWAPSTTTGEPPVTAYCGLQQSIVPDVASHDPGRP